VKPLKSGEIFVQDLGSSEYSSRHLVWIQSEEKPHRHADHDLTVRLLRGEGVLSYGAQSVPMRAGDLVVIPRGTAHAFVNRSRAPAAAFTFFSQYLQV
ncbi:MAG: cupin domain-containing protein, partial [Candidatus Binatia bacterium]